MHNLFEQGDLLHAPYEAFLFDTNKHAFPVRQHWHYYMEILYSVKGTFIATCDEQVFTLSEGDMVCFPPKSLHGIHSDHEEHLQYYVLKFDLGKFHESADFMPPLKAMVMQAATTEDMPMYFSKEALKDFPISFYFSSLAYDYCQRPYGYQVSMHATISCLLLSMIRQWRDLGFRPTNAVSAPTDNTLDTITEYIDAHSNQQLLVEDLAARCNMSYSFFAKKFKQLYGCSCKEYIEYIRVTKAEDLLLFTDNDLTFISQETGFSDSSHMIKTFKKYKRITPKQYRLQNTKAALEKSLF